MAINNHKKTRGFSYIEVIIALALFAIAILAVIPALSQAGRNMTFAMEAYDGYLQAQRIMHTVRGALIDGEDPVTRVGTMGSLEFSVWIFGRNAREFHSTNRSAIDRPDADVAIAGINMALTNQASTIVVVVWGNDGQVAGRAIGMVYS